MTGRTRRQADAHYQKVHDAEVERIRASVPDAAGTLRPAGRCVCGGELGWFLKQLTHLKPADHIPEVAR